ncbi:PGF-CTERM sorting domain-containing protein [Haladaptatus halobius]|uniref:PGF-CTERM sorting domain-containing protein n=1 Tax=Haladaptatus halobius TaxID=2884875 RepID=UPI001D0AAA36|nr:PGF-CTERM sorting domain-containing protein [Haladaptatus halobius]
MNKNKIVSIFLIGILLISSVGVVQADGAKDKDKDKDKEKKHPQKVVFKVEQMTIHNWSFVVGPDETPDRTVFVGPHSIKDKTFHLNANKLMKADSASEVAAVPAKKKAMAKAKKEVKRKKGETVRICFRNIRIQNVKVIVKLPEKMPNDMSKKKLVSSSEWQSLTSGDKQLPSYHITVERLSIEKWSFVVGPDETPDETITLGDVTLKDRTFSVDSSSMEDKQSMAAVKSVRDQVKEKMAKKGVKKDKTYRVIIQNIEIRNVKLVFGDSGEGDTPGETTTTTTTTTTEEDTSTTTTDSSDDGSGGDETTTESNGQPGFGVATAVVALLGAALLARRRQ